MTATINRNCAPWLSSWQRAVAAAVEHGAVDEEITVLPPASERDVRCVEKDLGRKLPAELYALFVNHSRAVDVGWKLPDSACPPKAFREISQGALLWNLDDMVAIDGNRREWKIPTWDEKLAFMVVGNGDMVAVDLAATGQSIVYLEHEEHAVRRLAPNLFAFIERWTTLGVPGPGIWSLEPFLGEDGLEPDGESGQQWRQWLGNDRADGKQIIVRPHTVESTPEVLARRLLKSVPIDPRREIEAWNLARVCLNNKQPRIALQLLDVLRFSSLKTEAVLMKIAALVELGQLADAHKAARSAIDEWLAPPTSLQSINQLVSKSQLLSALANLPGGATLAAEVMAAPDPDQFVPEGDFI